MKKKEKQLDEWTKRYYCPVYRQVFYMCRDRYVAEKAAEQTFLAACENVRKIRKYGDIEGWLMHAARYFMLKEIYSNWERGENVVEKFRMPELPDMETIHLLIIRYEAYV